MTSSTDQDFKGSTSRIEETLTPNTEKDAQYANVDSMTFHERFKGRVILDPGEAAIEFGERFAARLKTTDDGKTILWPQPTEDPLDPQNWSGRKKALHVFIITLATAVPNFDSGIGIASVFELAEQYNTSTGHINNLTSNWSVFLLAWGGFFDIMLMRRYGRLPVLFWTQLLSLAFLIGLTVAPTLPIFAGMRCLMTFFGTCPQITGLFVINDMYPFHLRARMASPCITIWTAAAVMGPHLSPFLFGFLVARQNWRWAFGIGCIYGLIVILLIAFCMEESIYDRKASTHPNYSQGFLARLKALVGITGWQLAGSGPSWKEVFLAPVNLLWRPHLVGIYVLLAMEFGFSVGINITNTIFLQSPPPLGLGFDPTIASAIYATPVVGVLIGEVLARYLMDWLMRWSLKRTHGVLEAENRLWALFIGVPLNLTGSLILGAALQHHFSVTVIVVGWGIAQISVLIMTVSIYSYANDCFPRRPGEVSAILNLMRTLGGFSVAYYQVPWSQKVGALQTFGLETGIVCGVFILVVPLLQWKGREIRVSKREFH
ncbi:MFS general substrate transporter [Dendrothele bispora CBS 962.96]|uniref:MFS general substrate transporter n=1 Tax=Dendrothele bispora (strain CBS 962.96) TaxID=1314807 RepID=A0A4S8LR19_DENBC|nr:MFS general substrate transporter [Dendrothele bispora CBS 962.96]